MFWKYRKNLLKGLVEQFSIIKGSWASQTLSFVLWRSFVVSREHLKRQFFLLCFNLGTQCLRTVYPSSIKGCIWNFCAWFCFFLAVKIKRIDWRESKIWLQLIWDSSYCTPFVLEAYFCLVFLLVSVLCIMLGEKMNLINLSIVEVLVWQFSECSHWASVTVLPPKTGHLKQITGPV